MDSGFCRKEGLIYLQQMLRSGRRMTTGELKKITDIFTRMFHDPHGKVLFFGLILKSLLEFNFRLKF